MAGCAASDLKMQCKGKRSPASMNLSFQCSVLHLYCKWWYIFFVTKYRFTCSVLYLKWWIFLMPGRGRKKGLRWDCQSPTGTRDVPSPLHTSWAVFTTALPLTRLSTSASDVTTERLKACLRSPKHQSGANLVCVCVSCHKEIECQGLEEISGHSPCTVPQDKAILVLSWTVIALEVGISLSFVCLIDFVLVTRPGITQESVNTYFHCGPRDIGL